MKVLLVGEYSGVHNNLKTGLKKLGVDVLLISTGDTWKNFDSDIILHTSGNVLKKQIYNYILLQLNKRNMLNVDVVQFINPSYFYYIDHYFADFAFQLMQHTKASVSLLAGCDCNMAKYFDRLIPNICPVCLKEYKKNNATCKFKSDYDYMKYEKQFYSRVDAIVPCEWDYYKIYNDYVRIYNDKLTDIILYPIDCSVIRPKYKKQSKLVVHHPFNRENKGTATIERVFRKLEKNFSGRVAFEIRGHMPIQQYLNYLDSIDIMVDGVEGYGYGLGMSSLMAMAKGKVVMGVKEKTDVLGMNNDWLYDNPQVEVGKDCEEIANFIEQVLISRDKLESVQRASRSYVRKYHDTRVISNKYLKLYKQLLNKELPV